MTAPATAVDAPSDLADALDALADLADELDEVKENARVLLSQADETIAQLSEELRCARIAQANTDARASLVREDLAHQRRRAVAAEHERDSLRLALGGQRAQRNAELSAIADAERKRTAEARGMLAKALEIGLAECERARREVRASTSARDAAMATLARIRRHADRVQSERDFWRTECANAIGHAEYARLCAANDARPAGGAR